MTQSPTVSVITISFNDLDGLKHTVESVRAQRYDGRIEHIVIDGGSGDAVVEYLSGCEPSFAYWQSQPDGGRYDAMNQGIAHASGDLLWFLHSADRFAGPDVVALAVESLLGKGPARDLWGFGMDRLIGMDRVRGPIPFSIRKFLAGKQVVPHQASFFGSSLVDKIGGYNLDFGIAADQEFILRAALTNDPVTIRRVFCEFDTTGVGSHREPKAVFDDLRRMGDLHGRYPYGGRRISRAYLRGRELYANNSRFWERVFGRISAHA
ncbi:glycosyltransferase [Mycobacterium kubicae]|uniref:glycosyltransferase family 2 protein n=1 Tax=Mycobacterium kubicae TaxID=120959 RepID=UPI0007FDCF5A|nr:glycosyltransferase family 2 protein [Mycobacterium kubicae]OBF18239.1 glycosyltransferase [Mycobacterium kubicae]